MVIDEIKQILNGVYEVTPDSGSVFFLRTRYLPPEGAFLEEKLFPGNSFSEEEALMLFKASLVFNAEKAAMSYLARAEQYRVSLEQKLLKKNIPNDAVKDALDYLEECGFLDDERFAGAWIRSRFIDHAEGRTRVTAELLSRGVKRSAVKNAVDEFFSERDETELCFRAYRKLSSSQKKNEEKAVQALVRKGFSFKIIKEVLKNGIENGED